MVHIIFFFVNFLASISFFYFSLIIFNQSSLAQTPHSDFYRYLIGLIFLFCIPLVLGLLFRLSKKLFYLILLPIFFIFIKFFLSSALNLVGLLLKNNLVELPIILLVSIVTTFILKSDIKIKHFHINNRWYIFFNLIIFSLMFFIVFNPKYKDSYEQLNFYGLESFHQFHHVNFFLMPASEILGGKTLMIDINSQYGILLTYINTLVLKIIGISYSNFILYNMLATFVYCCLFFIVLKKITRSYFWSILGLVAYLKLFFFRYPDFTKEIYIFPSTTPLRYFFDIIIVYLIYKYFVQPSKRRLWILSGLVVFAFFYNFDFGFPILTAFLITLLAQLLIKKINIREIARILLLLSSVFILAVGLITLFSYLRSGQILNWFSYFYIVFSFTRNVYPGNLFQSSMHVVDYYYLPITIYIVGYYYIVNNYMIEHRSKHPELVFLLFYGLITFVYYVNFAEQHHLWTVIHPALLIFFILLGYFIKTLSEKKRSLSFLEIFLPVVFFVVGLAGIFYSPGIFIKNAYAKFIDRYQENTGSYYYWGYQGTDFYLQDNDGKDFLSAANKISQLTKDSKQAVIISRYSPLLYLMTNKTSLIDHPNPEYDFYTVAELDQAVEKIKRLKPPYIFVYSNQYNQYYIPGPVNLMETLWQRVKDDYIFQETAGAVDVYKLR